MRLVIDVPTKKYLTVWQLRHRAGQLELPQQHHLRVLQEQLGDRLSVYIQEDWALLSDIVAHIDSLTTKFVFVAINQYLLKPEPVTALDDYAAAILRHIRTSKHYRVIDIQSQGDTTGSVGNFVFPDTRFLLCRKV
jgi:hypothetical protein